MMTPSPLIVPLQVYRKMYIKSLCDCCTNMRYLVHTRLTKYEVNIYINHGLAFMFFPKKGLNSTIMTYNTLNLLERSINLYSVHLINSWR